METIAKLELYCSSCQGMKFAGFFSEAEKARPDSVRLCISCRRKQSQANRGKYRSPGNGTSWAGNESLFMPGSVLYGKGRNTR
jgi:hypothetical protein